MELRAFLNLILAFIESESLTDEEFDSISLSEVAYDLATYEALKSVLQGREGVSGQLKKLKAFFLAKGVDVTEPARDPASQIFIGAPL